ncbi:MAG: thymidine phosphorylase [Bdellovibrionales bacterium]
MSDFTPTLVIRNRKRGLEHTEAELSFLIRGYIDGSIPDYQMSAFLMATYFNPLSKSNTSLLTRLMKESGETIKFNGIANIVDKHSTGGVGDKVTMICDPIVSACGLPVASIAGRGLGHTGGTLDKLESIRGFNVFLTNDEFVSQVKESGLAIMGQTENLCPADKKLYALRDVTETVDCIPLICASIMSKKLAEGVTGLVLDVKHGSGAFMKEMEQAKELAEWLKDIAENNGLKCHALLTCMEQPLGRFAGNAVEIKECIDILKGKTCIENDTDFYADTRELSLEIAKHMLLVGNKFDDEVAARTAAQEALESGRAFEEFQKMCRAQGAESAESIVISDDKTIVSADQAGYVTAVETETIGRANIQLRAGRLKHTDSIDPSTGVEWHFKIGDQIKKGQKLYTLYTSNESDVEGATHMLSKSVTISDFKIDPPPLIDEVLI